MENMLSNFNIDDSFSSSNSGLGSQELLDDLMAPETTSSNPADITPIIVEVEQPKTPEDKSSKKEIIPPLSPEGRTDEEISKNALSDFLSDNDSDEAQDSLKKPSEKENFEKKDAPSNSTSDKFKALSKELFSLGVFNKEEDESDEDVLIENPEAFLDRFQVEKKKGANEIVENFIGQFGEDYQKAFQAIYVKGVDPKKYFSTYNAVVDYAQMDMSEESNQRKVMRQALLNQEFEEDDIDTEIDRLVNYGDLETVSNKHHKILVKKEAAKLDQIEEEASQQLQQKNAIKNQYINNVRGILQEKLKLKEFDGIPLTNQTSNELQDFLLVDKWKTPSGETLTDFDKTILDMKRPENHLTKVKLALILKLLEKDPTLQSIQKKGVTTQTNNLFAEVVRQVESKTPNNKAGQPASARWDL